MSLTELALGRMKLACEVRAEGATLQIIGGRLGVSRERARQILWMAQFQFPELYKQAKKLKVVRQRVPTPASP